MEGGEGREERREGKSQKKSKKEEFGWKGKRTENYALPKRHNGKFYQCKLKVSHTAIASIYVTGDRLLGDGMICIRQSAFMPRHQDTHSLAN